MEDLDDIALSAMLFVTEALKKKISETPPGLTQCRSRERYLVCQSLCFDPCHVTRLDFRL